MEVHAHTHTARKKWTHYFWEFLMLFLAVFCGFLAENQREHIVEHQREKKYMKSMLADLAADTVFINDEEEDSKSIVQWQTSMQKDLYSDSVFEKVKTAYNQYAGYFRLLTPRFNDQTITQLRNSGNLRLVRNTEIEGKLSEYWKGINTLMKVAERVEQRYDVSAEMASRIYNRKYMISQFDTATNRYQYSIDPKAEFMTHDRNELIAFANIVNRILSSIEGVYIPVLQLQKDRAMELILLIKKEYDLK